MKNFYLFVLLAAFFGACSSSSAVMDKSTERIPSAVSKEEVVQKLPDYRDELDALKGKGRALVSESGKSDRFTLNFEADRDLSLIVVKNRIGIEGGRFLVDSDSILIYNKLDKIAQKVSVYDGRMTSLNELASINVLNLINFTIDTEDIVHIEEDNYSFYLFLKDRSEIKIKKKDGLITKVSRPASAGVPYSVIEYDGYGSIKGFTLPRKINIFSTDGNSRVAFIVRSLDVNPDKLKLELKIPENIIIQRL